jgi:hypothetical protein
LQWPLALQTRNTPKGIPEESLVVSGIDFAVNTARTVDNMGFEALLTLIMSSIAYYVYSRFKPGK